MMSQIYYNMNKKVDVLFPWRSWQFCSSYYNGKAVLVKNFHKEKYGENSHLIYWFQTSHYGQTPIPIKVLDFKSLEWIENIPYTADKTVVKPPSQSHGITVTAFDDNIFLIGGANSRDEVVYAFNLRTHTWWQPKNLRGDDPPGPRRGHTANLYGQYLYIFGGFDYEYGHVVDKLYTLDLVNFTWRLIRTSGTTIDIPFHHTAEIINDRLYVFGGATTYSDMSPKAFSNTLKYLDLTSLRWKNVQQQVISPSGRAFHSSFQVNGEMYIFGGINYKEKMTYNDMWCLETHGQGTKLKWKRVLYRVPSAQVNIDRVLIKNAGRITVPPRLDHCCCMSRGDNRLIILGGCNIDFARNMAVMEVPALQVFDFSEIIEAVDN